MAIYFAIYKFKSRQRTGIELFHVAKNVHLSVPVRLLAIRGKKCFHGNAPNLQYFTRTSH